MTRYSHEQLLGYLLGALDSKECIEVERAVAGSPEVAAEFEKLRHSLGTIGLLDEPEQVDPPLCLVARTCEFVEMKTELYAADTVILKSVTADAVNAADEVAAKPKVKLSPVTRAEVTGTSMRKLDLIVACSVVLVGAALCFPLLFTSQLQANITRCQNQLQQIGLALQSYSNQQPDGSFPHVPAEGPRNVAGIYAPTLVSNQFVEDSSTFFCPGNPQVGASLPDKFRIPTLDEIDRAPEPLLARYHNAMGGSYGYSLGYQGAESVLPPRNSRRANYALLADAPHDSQPGRMSTNHDRRGQNMLFEDGHVRFVNMNQAFGDDARESALDDPFHNRRGEVAAGIDIEDIVLGRSNDRPMPIVLP